MSACPDDLSVTAGSSGRSAPDRPLGARGAQSAGALDAGTFDGVRRVLRDAAGSAFVGASEIRSVFRHLLARPTSVRPRHGTRAAGRKMPDATRLDTLLALQ